MRASLEYGCALIAARFLRRRHGVGDNVMFDRCARCGCEHLRERNIKCIVLDFWKPISREEKKKMFVYVIATTEKERRRYFNKVKWRSLYVTSSTIFSLNRFILP